MTKAMEIYNELKDQLGNEEKVTATITKREYQENGWTYSFLFYKGELSKIEAFNHREFIELWNK